MIHTSQRLRRVLHAILATVMLSSAVLVNAPLMAADSEAPALENLSLATLSQHLSDQAPACMRFEQRRWMADLDFELPSEGYFHRQPDRLVWQTLSPVQDRVVLGSDNPKLPPGLKALLPILNGLLAGDWERLEQHFQASLSGSLRAWKIGLIARNSAVAEQLEGIEASGGDAVTRLNVIFTNGDRLALELTPEDCAILTAEAPTP